jgi:hypothetical protein
MAESRVSALAGEPDEVGLKGSAGFVEEAYRWVYGFKSKGDFPLIGAVIFRTNHTVLTSYCPTRPFPLIPPVPFSESAQSSPSGIRCTIDRVFRNPDFYNSPYIRVSVQNTGTIEFRYTNDHTGIRFSLILEVYDAHKAVVLREPLFRYHSPYIPFRSEWPVMVVAPGARYSEDVPIWWRDESDGRLPNGTYYVRVSLPFEDKKFFGSDLAKWEFPGGRDDMR